jgi:hypothetical protein
LRRSENAHWLTQGPRPFPPDPDDVFEELGKLMFGREVDVTPVLGYDPAEVEAQRRHQKMALARYGRIDPFSWEGRELNELRFYYAELVSLLKKEAMPSMEDRR